MAIELADLLVAVGVNPAAKNKDGQTAIDWARRRGMIAVARRLERPV
jgi:ankyrin repeat protein